MKRRVMALFLALTMLVSMAPAVFAADTGFSDVAADAWYSEAVAWAVENGITGGIGEGLFGPDHTCTRGQVVTFLWAAAGKPVMENADNPFTDVKATDWYYNAVMWAVENNITGGTSATTFSPEAPCTRAAVVTFLYAAEGKPGVDDAENSFTDVSSGDWFYAPVMWAVANNITGGIGNGLFGPDNACTRGQIALFLYKASLIGDDVPEVTPPISEVMNVKDAADAIAQLAAADSDYDNALSELTEKSTNTIEGDSYYRLQQNYKGIPVYGRTVVCATDENGDVMSITGNVADVDESVDLTPSVTAEKVEDAVEAYLGDGSDVAIPVMTDKELVVYVDDEGTSALAYALTAFVGTEPYEVVVDADIGMVYEMQSLVRTETVSKGYRLAEGEKLLKLNFWYEDGTYSMDDRERNIQIYSANGKNAYLAVYFFDRNGELICYITQAGDECYNAEGEKIPEPSHIDGYMRIYFYVDGQKLELEPRDSVEEWPTTPLEIMSYAVNVHDFYRAKLERNGWANDLSKPLPVAYNIAGTLSMSYYDDGAGSIRLAKGAGLDTVAHEFTHNVNAIESGLFYYGESGAIDEALADIFGELAEYYYYGTCDWLHANGKRNLIDPYSSNGDHYPSTYKGEYWQNSADDNGGVHQNSTVLSLAAYLMSTDGGGKLTMDELGKLWYRAMLLMPSDCNFYTCRRLVELSGVNMGLDSEQMECISHAFDKVNIKPQVEIDGYDLYNLHFEGKLNVFGIDGKPYGNYIAVLTLVPYFNGELDIEGIYDLYPKWGLYRCKLIDVTDSVKTKEFYINITYNQEDDHIDIYTDFGKVKVTGTVKEVTLVNDVQFLLPIEGATVTAYSKLTNKPVNTASITDINKGFAFTLPAGDYYLEASAEGYITSKTDFTVGTEDVELDIILEPTEVDNEAAYAAYVPMVEKAIRDTKNCWSFYEATDKETAQGYLVDLDGDGIDELLMNYHYEYYYYNNGGLIARPVYSLYDYEDGKLVTVVDRKVLIQAIAGGDLGSAAVVTFDGRPTVMIMDKIGDGGGPGVTHLYNYEFYDYPSMERKYLLGYWQEEGESGLADEKFYINDAEVTKESFLGDLARCPDLQFSRWGYDFYNGDPMSLRETLNKLVSVEYEIKKLGHTYYDDDVPFLKYTYDKVVLLNETEGAAAINAAIDKDAEAFLSELDEDDVFDLMDHPAISHGGTFLYTAKPKVTNYTHNVFSVYVVRNVNLGGNGNSGREYGMNFDLNTGEPIVLTELFGMDEATLTAKLKSEAWAYLREHHEKALFENARDTIYDFTLDQFVYYFEDGELILIFNPYTIASGAAGSFTVPTGMILK